MAEKALASAADAVFLDLEDAVPPDEKAEARPKVARALKELDWSGRPTLYRANALDTPYFYRDVIEVVEEAGEELDALMVPKVQRPEDLHVVATLLYQLELSTGLEPGRIRIEAQIESAEGLVNVDGIARATGRLTVLNFGLGDYAASVRMPQTSIGTMDEWDEAYPGHRFHYAMHRIVVVARAAGLRAVDGPVADHRDEEGLRESCLLARSASTASGASTRPGSGPSTTSSHAPRRKSSGRRRWWRPTRRRTRQGGAPSALTAR
jgi:citrate lyase beta subunit